MLVEDAAPVWGQFPLVFAVGGADGVVGALPLFLQPAATVVQQPVAALKTEGQTQIHQFQQVEMLARVGKDGVEQLEEFSPPQVSL